MNKANILLVDDHPENLIALEAVLADLGQNLVKANSGEEALRHLLRQDFALILLDVHMDGMDGFETATLIRSRERSHYTPIIFLTAVDKDGALAFKGYLSGAVDYLVKPVVPEILRAKAQVFIDLFTKTQLLNQQLQEINQLNQSVKRYRRATQERQRLLTQEHEARSHAELKQQQMAFLAEASALLSASLDYKTALKNLASLVVPRMADVYIAHLMDGDGRLQQLTALASSPEKDPYLHLLSTFYTPDPNTLGQRVVLYSCQSEIAAGTPESFFTGSSEAPDVLDTVRALQITSLIVVPLLVRKHCIGAISLATTDSYRLYDQEDLMLAENLAHRIALTIENAFLYREAQQALELRNEFLSVAAHELRTPITSLQGFAQLLIRQIDKTSTINPTHFRQVISRIDQQSQKLTYLISQLLDVSRVQAGRLSLDLQEVDVISLIEALVANIEVISNRHTINIHTVASVPVIQADPLRLEQVLTNLIGNAIKYSPDGGPIDLDISMTDETTMQLSVTDYGIGIPVEHRQKIFAPFYQAHAGNPAGGLGLGLYISAQIIEMHCGKIEVEFPPDGGTRFVICLPISIPVGAY